MRIGILDDYLDIVTSSADWSLLPADMTVEVFREHIKPDRVAAVLGGFDVLVATRERMAFPKATVDQLPNLKLLITTGRNNKSFDMAALRARGVVVCGTPNYNASTLELTWALILGLAKHIPLNDRTLHDGGWQAALGRSLCGSTLGVVGLGRIGTGTSTVGKTFGMEVIAWSPNLTPERAAAGGARYATKKELFATSDVVAVHMALGPRTVDLISHDDFAVMKPTAFIVNTSRGPLINEAALLDALTRGLIGGAGLDVFWEEPLARNHPIRSAPNVLMTGHMGYNTIENAKMAYPAVVDDILAWRAGAPIRLVE